MAEGTQLGKYTLKRQLATGGMAEIWLGEQRGPGGFAKELVVKRILPHLASDEKFVQMFLDEARLAAQLTHPNIVQIFDLGEAEGSYFIAMEYIRGHDLAALREAGRATGAPLDWLAAARIVADACAGLDYAHNFTDSRGRPMNLVHRDVSPQNILVSDQGAVKLVDFGVAKAATSTHKTQTGAVKGKFAYMSPEQIKGVELDGRSDLFAMGIVLFELLTGQRPFGAESELLALTAIMHHPAPDPQELNPSIPQPLRDIVSKALEKSADDRFQTAEAMQGALEAVLAQTGQPVGRKTLATYIGSLFQGAPLDLSAGVVSDPTTAGGVRKTEEGVPFSLRHGPADQPTQKRSSDPGIFNRETRQMAADQAMAGRDTRPMPARRGVSGGLVAAIVIVFLALAGAGYYLYTTIDGRAGSDPVASGSGDGADAAQGSENDAGLATSPTSPDVGPTESTDTGGAVAQQPDTGQTAPTGADTGSLAVLVDAGVADTGVAQVADTGVVLAVDAAGPDLATPPIETDIAPTIAAADAGTAQPDVGATIVVADAGLPPSDTAVASPETGGEPTSPDAAVVAVVPDASPIVDAVATVEPDTGTAAEPDVTAAVEVDAAIEPDVAVAVEEDVAEEADVTVAVVEDTGIDDDDDDDDESRSNRPGRVRVRIAPRGRYEVLIDGEVVGRTPLPRQTLSPGRHLIEVRRVGESHTVSERVRVRPGSDQTVRITFE